VIRHSPRKNQLAQGEPRAARPASDRDKGREPPMIATIRGGGKKRIRLTDTPKKEKRRGADSRIHCLPERLAVFKPNECVLFFSKGRKRIVIGGSRKEKRKSAPQSFRRFRGGETVEICGKGWEFRTQNVYGKICPGRCGQRGGKVLRPVSSPKDKTYQHTRSISISSRGGGRPRFFHKRNLVQKKIGRKE